MADKHTSKRAAYKKERESIPKQKKEGVPDDRAYLYTETVFLIGNGRSRENFDLNRLREKGTILGCNALYRDFEPDILVSIDAKMHRELMDANYEGFVLFPNNRNNNLKNPIRWKTNGSYNTSGCFGMKYIQQELKAKTCYMLGMDGYPGNVYDGTRNYATVTLANLNGVTSNYLKTLQEPQETVFINVNTKDEWPAAAHETGRYKFMTYSEFEKQL